jgi:3-oxoacyl-[acyl-carrier-protein] synthase-3
LLSDYIFPGTGVLLQRDLGCKRNIPALDIRNQCSGFLYGLQVADAWIRSGMYKSVLLVTAEVHSTSLDKTPAGRDLGVLFGDAASACLLEACEDSSSGRVLDVQVYSQGEFAENLALLEPSPNRFPRLAPESLQSKNIYPKMDGRLVFKNAVERMTESMNEVCRRNKISLEEVDFVVPHQANRRINQVVLEQLGIPESKTHYTIDRYANTTSCTIPLTFDEAVELKKIKRGDLVALTAFGSGFTWGSALVRY